MEKIKHIRTHKLIAWLQTNPEQLKEQDVVALSNGQKDKSYKVYQTMVNRSQNFDLGQPNGTWDIDCKYDGEGFKTPFPDCYFQLQLVDPTTTHLREEYLRQVQEEYGDGVQVGSEDVYMSCLVQQRELPDGAKMSMCHFFKEGMTTGFHMLGGFLVTQREGEDYLEVRKIPAPGINQEREDAMGYMFGCVTSACKLMECSNIQVEYIPAPVNLNHKRAKKGKPPLYSFKIINLLSKAGRNHSEGTGKGGKKRFHYVRGFIRRLSPTRTTWIPAHTRGKGGFSDHDYELR